jgi:hypothetical protein
LLGACLFDPAGLGGDGDLTGTPGDDGNGGNTGNGGPAKTPASGETAPTPDVTTVACTAWQFIPRMFHACDLPAPTGGLRLDSGTYTYDTDRGELRAPGGQLMTAPASLTLQIGGHAVRAVAVDELRIAAGAQLRAIGSQPLLLASFSRATVAGAIDVSSSQTVRGAGALASCEGQELLAGAASAKGGGGGAGASFGLPGGAGAAGANDDQQPIPGGAARVAADWQVMLRGGCPGGTGGVGTAGATPADSGRGGWGGGAIQLVAAEAITIAGQIRAGGAGGGSGSVYGGGGGGGSGGLVGIEAPSIQLAGGARLLVSGGGGAAGAAHGQPGQSGQDAPLDGSPAGGGLRAHPHAGDGGSGGTVGSSAQGGTAESDGGGGGGGGAGFVALYRTTVEVSHGIVDPDDD